MQINSLRKLVEDKQPTIETGGVLQESLTIFCTDPDRDYRKDSLKAIEVVCTSYFKSFGLSCTVNQIEMTEQLKNRYDAYVVSDHCQISVDVTAGGMSIGNFIINYNCDRSKKTPICRIHFGYGIGCGSGDSELSIDFKAAFNRMLKKKLNK